jgi:membrane-associated protease RseP (regulator of RpoE activity)
VDLLASSYLDEFSKAIPLISSYYSIKDFHRDISGEYMELMIDEIDIRSSFPTLLAKLQELGLVATAKRAAFVSRLLPSLSSAQHKDKSIVITLYKTEAHKSQKRRRIPIPLILFAATVIVVFIDGIFKSRAFSDFYANDPVILSAIYTTSLLGILGVHEMGHMIAAKTYGLRASWPYFIPSIPVFFLSPTFGAMIQLRSNMPNRNAMFDVGIAGPIAGLVVAIVVSIYGASISVVVPAGSALSGGYSIQPSLLMTATIELAGKAVDGGILVWSPVLMAAWIGFLVTFLNLLPAWQLDGGHLARSALGSRWHKILTYSSIGVLLITGWYFMAILVLILSFRIPESTPLDDVTPLSRGRKAFFVVAIVLAGVCASPFPRFFI